jgi:hypothetical protein
MTRPRGFSGPPDGQRKGLTPPFLSLQTWPLRPNVEAPYGAASRSPRRPRRADARASFRDRGPRDRDGAMIQGRAVGGSGAARSPEWRFIVPADEPEQYHYLSRMSAERPAVEVILDRRRGERRQQDAGKWFERRKLERRRGHEIRARQFVFVGRRGRVTWKMPEGSPTAGGRRS